MNAPTITVAFAAIYAFPAAAIAQQPDPLTDFQITGHVYEPQAVPPTDERVNALNLPQGFDIARFAEGLHNPRMLAVADNGTIYVTQRTPGNLVMLRDVDGDGIVASLPAYNRHALLKEMEGHVLASGEVIGTFARAP